MGSATSVDNPFAKIPTPVLPTDTQGSDNPFAKELDGVLHTETRGIAKEWGLLMAAAPFFPFLVRSETEADKMTFLVAFVVSVFVFLLGLVGFVVARYRGKKTIVLRQNSISIVRKGEETRCNFDVVKSVRWLLNVESGSEQKGIKYVYDLKLDTGGRMKFKTNSKFTTLIESISEKVSPRLKVTLASKGKVAWNSDVSIEKDGIRLLVRKSLLARRRLLKWEEIRGVELKERKMVVFIHGTKRAVAEVNSDVVNFYPGLHLFRELFNAGKEAAEQMKPIGLLLS